MGRKLGIGQAEKFVHLRIKIRTLPFEPIIANTRPPHNPTNDHTFLTQAQYDVGKRERTVNTAL
jgi:hypothetical protein